MRPGLGYGSADVEMTKQEIREMVWARLQEERVARFPGARGRIPNFKGAERCADHLESLDVWRRAKFIKANPDSPQRAIRHLALKSGKVVYMAVPRLASDHPFIELDPKKLTGSIYKASSIKGAVDVGRPVSLAEMSKIDLVVCGSVAVNRNGARVGKGGGYSDLEYAIALEARILTRRTPILTTVHPLQIVEREIDLQPYDIAVDIVVTPDEVIECRRSFPRPRGIYWKHLEEEKIASIPVLEKMRRQRTRSKR